MKPIKIEFQAFGPYAGTQVVDFEKLADKGLFLICGETGSGKTMFLDAMTFALYGKSSGNGRNDFVSNRCLSADGDTSTYVRFTFEAGGDYYLFERRLDKKRVKLSESYSCMKRDEDMVWQPLLENPKEKDLNAKAVELVGLEYDQFRQVIILPQGQFEKLLTSNSDEKEKILTNIFGERIWQGIADKFYEEAYERKESLNYKRERIESALAEEGCSSIEQLELLICQKQEELNKLSEEYAEAGYDHRRAQLQSALALARRFVDMRKAVWKKENLTAHKPQMDDLSRRLADAGRAEQVRVLIDKKSESDKALESRNRALEQAYKSEEDKKVQVETAASNLTAHIVKQSEIEELSQKKTLMSEHRGDYESIDKVYSIYQNCESDYQKCTQTEEKARETYDSFGPLLARLQSEYESLNEEHKRLLDSYIGGISGELASDLIEGKQCPVCGSTSHPHKALLLDDHVTKEKVDAQKNTAETKYKELQECLSRRDDAKKSLDDLSLKTKEASEKLSEAKAKYASMKESLIAGINTLDELNSQLKLIEEKLSAYESKKLQLEKQLDQARINHTEAKSRIATAEDELKNAQEICDASSQALATGIASNGFASIDEAKASLLSQNQIHDYTEQVARSVAEMKAVDEQIVQLREELDGKTETKEEECLAALEEIEEAGKAYNSSRTLFESDIERLTRKVESIKLEGEGITELIRQADEDVIFAKKLRGDTGTGLQRYVLGIMFSSVISSANKMLELVHDGRYSLFRSDDKVQGSNKRGLELKVQDKYSDSQEGRFVNTLSGGEKFLVSLALSIGMSQIAQKSGIRIETIFIDEGFGSLDENSIVDAMNVLGTVQEAHGLVGIISHVQLLQDRIPTKLIVSKKNGESHITTTVG